MPPKSKKAAQEKVKKSVEDKTFGLKNKNKSSKVKEYVSQVKQQAQASTTQGKKNLDSGPTKKDLERQKKEELNDIFKPVQVQQKVPFGVDPKTVLCQFFKAGTCTKGKQCKFAHDTAVDRKATKIDLYTDARDEEQKKDDTMDKWDQAKLEEVVQKKHGKGIQTTTDIVGKVCKFFIAAVEDRKYGWFWTCPNGESCKYRHALPPGFVLNEKGKRKAEDDNVQTLEEWIEEQRGRLPDKLTPVTLETFNVWKSERQLKRAKEQTEREKKTEAAVKAGRSMGISGRELFTFNPNLFEMSDDDEAWDGDYTQREEEDQGDDNHERGAPKAFDASLFAAESLEGLSVDDLEEGDK